MLNDAGNPREIDLVILRRKLGGIAKGKAPGYTGNGPDLYASLPDSWAVWAVRLANLILFTQVTPHNWHIDLVHYVHKGGVDGSLSNHRPLALVEVFRKVVTSIVCDRLKRDFARLNILDPTNPGFQTGRTTANSIFPLRIAGEHCLHTETELSALLDDLKWCFDTPASTVVELALRRLGVPMFYINMLNDNDSALGEVNRDGEWKHGRHRWHDPPTTSWHRARYGGGADQLDPGGGHCYCGRTSS